MKKHLYLLFLLVIVFCCEKKQVDSGFIIDENIKEEVNSKISKSELGNPFESLFLVYDNLFLADYFEKDSITFSSRSKQKQMLFRSFYYKKNDTITIDGAFGLFGGFGFSLKVLEDKVILYHLLAGDDFPTYSKTKDGKLEFRIEVPCTETKVILSKIPEVKEDEVIYGMVEFKSDVYYKAKYIDSEGESNDREENQVAMKIYFKSKYFDFDKPIDYKNENIIEE